jgi:hypothetical protein
MSPEICNAEIILMTTVFESHLEKEVLPVGKDKFGFSKNSYSTLQNLKEGGYAFTINLNVIDDIQRILIELIKK